MTDEPTIGDILASYIADVMTQPLIVRAGRGDLAALRELANASYAAIGEPGVSAPLAYMEAINFARLAAADGGNADARVLMFLLSQFAAFWNGEGNAELATQFEAQALTLAENLAEDGDDEVADMVIAAAPIIPAAVFHKARQLRAAEADINERS